MKTLLYKELRLVVSPAVYFFTLLGALLLIPNYPYCVSTSYCIWGIYIIFGTAKVNKDQEFTAALPVPRRHIVLGKHLSVMVIQLTQLVVAIPFALVSSLILNKSGNIVGMDANVAFFGFALIAFSVFDFIFLSQYFKTGYKLGIPMLAGGLGYLFTLLFFELLTAFVPALKAIWDTTDPSKIVYQLPVLFVGLALYFSALYLSYRISVKNFERVSL